MIDLDARIDALRGEIARLHADIAAAERTTAELVDAHRRDQAERGAAILRAEGGIAALQALREPGEG